MANMTAKWIEGNYGFWFLRLPGKFTVTVGWDSTRPKDSAAESGFKVSFEDAVLVKRFENLAEAKVAGEALAKRVLSKALEAMNAS